MKNMKNLEQKVEQQQNEIQSLKDCVNHLRNSLQLSDAQVRKKTRTTNVVRNAGCARSRYTLNFF